MLILTILTLQFKGSGRNDGYRRAETQVQFNGGGDRTNRGRAGGVEAETCEYGRSDGVYAQ